MTIVHFLHDNEEKITNAEHWLKYWIFDAEDQNGETWPVRKEDCTFLTTEEI